MFTKIFNHLIYKNCIVPDIRIHPQSPNMIDTILKISKKFNFAITHLNVYNPYCEDGLLCYYCDDYNLNLNNKSFEQLYRFCSFSKTNFMLLYVHNQRYYTEYINFELGKPIQRTFRSTEKIETYIIDYLRNIKINKMKEKISELSKDFE